MQKKTVLGLILTCLAGLFVGCSGGGSSGSSPQQNTGNVTVSGANS